MDDYRKLLVGDISDEVREQTPQRILNEVEAINNQLKFIGWERGESDANKYCVHVEPLLESCETSANYLAELADFRQQNDSKNAKAVAEDLQNEQKEHQDLCKSKGWPESWASDPPAAEDKAAPASEQVGTDKEGLASSSRPDSSDHTTDETIEDAASASSATSTSGTTSPRTGNAPGNTYATKEGSSNPPVIQCVPIMQTLRPGYTEDGEKILCYQELRLGGRLYVERNGGYVLIPASEGGGSTVLDMAKTEANLPRVGTGLEDLLSRKDRIKRGNYGIKHAAVGKIKPKAGRLPDIVCCFSWEENGQSHERLLVRSDLGRVVGPASANKMLAAMIHPQHTKGVTLYEALCAANPGFEYYKAGSRAKKKADD